MKPLREHYEVDTDLGTNLRTFDYINDIEKYTETVESENQRLKEELDKANSLLMETVMRCQIAMPETEQQLKWFEETCAVVNSGDYFERITKALNLGNIDE